MLLTALGSKLTTTLLDAVLPTAVDVVATTSILSFAMFISCLISALSLEWLYHSLGRPMLGPPN